MIEIRLGRVGNQNVDILADWVFKQSFEHG